MRPGLLLPRLVGLYVGPHPTIGSYHMVSTVLHPLTLKSQSLQGWSLPSKIKTLFSVWDSYAEVNRYRIISCPYPFPNNTRHHGNKYTLMLPLPLVYFICHFKRIFTVSLLVSPYTIYGQLKNVLLYQ